ncbi:acetylserotonin O-methyltransferase [Streptomyces sp. KCTC 0041BP]|uniref:acetylserotonin O-methyltransferase n=1 Tax=Streptomyces sp. KCTC 0041BP TaxID=201500 RepID=UPI001FD7FA42|nr:acetylserotonin O-methyltransferase [Streptomyces sp. KCTC 0041BP]
MSGEDGTGAALWAMAHLATPMALRVAATLRVADHISAGVRTAPEIAREAKADPDALARLLRYLAARGVLRRDAAGGYELTALGEPLRDDHPDGMRAKLDIEGTVGRAELCFVHLLHTIRTGEAAYPLQYGLQFWDDLDQHPERGASFDTWMSSSAPDRAQAIIAGYAWGDLGDLVDVGGGNGSLLVALLRAFPQLNGTLVDMSEPAATAQRALEAAGLTDRGRAVVGSFFDPLPKGAKGYLLSLIIHDWGDAEAVEILARCAEAAGADGSVFVVENLGADGETPPAGMDLRMLAFSGGKERGLAELAGLAERAGLRIVARHGAGTLSIVEMAAATLA